MEKRPDELHKTPIGLLDSVLSVRYMYLCLKKIVLLHCGELELITKWFQFSHDRIKIATFRLSAANLHRADQAMGSTCYPSSTKHYAPPI